VHIALRHLVEQGDEDAGPACADGVTDGDGTAVDVETILGNGELAADRHGLRRERFVELEEVDVTKFDACFCSAARTAGTGPIPMIRGATPALE